MLKLLVVVQLKEATLVCNALEQIKILKACLLFKNRKLIISYMI